MTSNDNQRNTSKSFKSQKTLTDDLFNKLYDDSLIKRYGTSLNVNMGREYKEFLEKKYEVLEKEFSRINKDSNDFIDIAELTEFVNSYKRETGKTLPEDYCSKLFKLIDLNEDKNITIQEFIFSYMLLEERLKLKKIKLEKTLEEVNKAAEKALTERNKFTKEELNKNGVATDANLNVILLEARELKPMDFNGKSDPYCVFSINGGQKQKSTYKPNQLDPIWNEEFNL
jgi:Ca2+-binding EF-hand superfamily protein